MPKFRSKPIEIEATQFNKQGDHPAVVFAKSMGGQSWASNRFVVLGHQGHALVNIGDWIISEADGNGYYPCDPETFARKYEPIDGPEQREAQGLSWQEMADVARQADNA